MTVSPLVRPTLGVLSLVLGIGASARAQDCAALPLLGRRAALGLGYSQAADEDGVAANGTLALATHLRVSAGYAGTRIGDIDRLRHEVNGAVALPVDVGRVQLCPRAGGSLARLSTDRSALQGEVTTRETFYGASIGVPIALTSRLQLTPFLEPLAVHRTVSWESTDVAWIVSGKGNASETQLWFGATLATGTTALVIRARPSSGRTASALAVSVVTAFGR